MSSDDVAIVSILIVFLAIGIAIGAIVTRQAVVSDWQHKAVDAGHAEFYIDEEGRRAWRWKECE